MRIEEDSERVRIVRIARIARIVRALRIVRIVRIDDDTNDTTQYYCNRYIMYYMVIDTYALRDI